MQLVLEGERRLSVRVAGAEFAVQSSDSSIDFSPLHMLAASLATCTVAVLAGWAAQAELGVAGLEIGIEWDYVENPYRVGRYAMAVHWPGLPASRRDAAIRAARHCTVEHTLTHPPAIDISVAD